MGNSVIKSIFFVGTPVGPYDPKFQNFHLRFQEICSLQKSNSNSGLKKGIKYEIRQFALVACMEKPFCKYRASEHTATTQPLAKGEIGRVSWDRSSPCARAMRRMTTASTRAQLKRYERGVCCKGAETKRRHEFQLIFNILTPHLRMGGGENLFPEHRLTCSFCDICSAVVGSSVSRASNFVTPAVPTVYRPY